MLVKRFTCSCVRLPHELPVKAGLAITPAKMLEMAQRGIPVTTANAADMAKFGETNPSWDIPLDRIRGVDVATMWEHSKVIKERASKSYVSKLKELKK